MSFEFDEEQWLKWFEEQWLRWFGEPWPSADARAQICADDAYRTFSPVGERCLGCGSPIEPDDRGVLTLASAEIRGAFLFELGDDAVVSVCAYHIDCLLEAVVPGVDGISRKP